MLVGQPELQDLIDRPELRQLRQRIALRHHLRPFNDDEVAEYVNDRLSKAGYTGRGIFKKKARVRPPRVHITYEVETGDAMVLKELPFVVGTMADLSGQPKESLGKLKDRKFVEIDRDNFDDVLKSMKPRLALKVDNTMKDDGSQLSGGLNVAKLGDFSPENVSKQVKPLADLLAVRG